MPLTCPIAKSAFPCLAASILVKSSGSEKPIERMVTAVADYLRLSVHSSTLDRSAIIIVKRPTIAKAIVNPPQPLIHVFGGIKIAKSTFHGVVIRWAKTCVLDGSLTWWFSLTVGFRTHASLICSNHELPSILLIMNSVNLFLILLRFSYFCFLLGRISTIHVFLAEIFTSVVGSLTLKAKYLG